MRRKNFIKLLKPLISSPTVYMTAGLVTPKGEVVAPIVECYVLDGDLVLNCDNHRLALANRRAVTALDTHNWLVTTIDSEEGRKLRYSLTCSRSEYDEREVAGNPKVLVRLLGVMRQINETRLYFDVDSISVKQANKHDRIAKVKLKV